MRAARNIALIAGVALVLTVLPGGGPALNVVLTAISAGFFIAIAMLGGRLYRQFSFELDALEERRRLVLYGSIALAFFTFTATQRLFDEGGVGVISWIALLALASYGVFWVWMSSREYD